MKNFIPDFLIIPTQLLRDKEIRPAEQLVYGVVYWFHSLKEGVCFASNPAIAEIASISARTVQNSLTVLEKQGYVRRTFQDGKRQIIPIITFGKGSPKSYKDGEIANKMKCHYCGTKDLAGSIFEYDHYLPKSKGGQGGENLVLCCRSCNSKKKNMHGDDFKKL